MSDYLARFLEKNKDRPIGNTRQNRQKPGSAGSAGGSHKESVPISTPWPPRPQELADWPIDRRQRWGELANALEAQGVLFPESERRAFGQIKAQAEQAS